MGLVEETTTQVIQDQGEQYVFQMLCFLIVFKIASTAFCLSCGMHGGIFGPSLCIGAMVGAACALATVPSYYPIFALAGMGACISSVIGAPISTILIVFELNQNYSVATAVMVAVVVSNLITNRFFSRSFFVHQVFTAGFDVNAGREVLILQRRRIQEVMQRNFQVLSPDASALLLEKRGMFSRNRNVTKKKLLAIWCSCQGTSLLKKQISTRDLRSLQNLSVSVFLW